MSNAIPCAGFSVTCVWIHEAKLFSDSSFFATKWVVYKGFRVEGGDNEGVGAALR